MFPSTRQLRLTGGSISILAVMVVAGYIFYSVYYLAVAYLASPTTVTQDEISGSYVHNRDARLKVFLVRSNGTYTLICDREKEIGEFSFIEPSPESIEPNKAHINFQPGLECAALLKGGDSAWGIYKVRRLSIWKLKKSGCILMDLDPTTGTHFRKKMIECE